LKVGDKLYRCDIERKGLEFTVSATIEIDVAYPQVPPVFKLEVLGKTSQRSEEASSKKQSTDKARTVEEDEPMLEAA